MPSTENKWTSRKLAAFGVSVAALLLLALMKADAQYAVSLAVIAGAYVGMQGLVDRYK